MRTAGVCAALVFTAAVDAQVATTANSGYQTEEQRKGVAKGLSNPERDNVQCAGIVPWCSP